jgi:WD40 repeat protein
LNETVESDNKIVSCIWDPLGKYICWLSLGNNVHVYNLSSKKVETSVSLNLKADKSELFVSKEERLMDFSPDLNYLLVPSLDDKKMPFVCALKRSNNFQIEFVFAGHFSSITCVKFYPAIFERKVCSTRPRCYLLGLRFRRRLRTD